MSTSHFDFAERQWLVREAPFHPQDMPHMETIFTIGNGFVGTRGTFEEGYPGDDSTTLAAGIFNHAEGTLVPDLVSLPNWLALTLTVNDQDFRMDQGTILGYERVLDMRTATLTRGVLWMAPGGEILRLRFERFASLHNPHLMALRVEVQALSEGTHPIAVRSSLNADVRNPGGVDHWQSLRGQAEGQHLHITGRTNQSGYQVAMAAHLHSTHEGELFSLSDDPVRCTNGVLFTLNENETAVLTKLVALHTSRDSTDPEASAEKTLAAAIDAGWDALKGAHDSAWADYWAAMDVQIDGDELAQRALRFNAYHLLIAVPRHEERVSIGAKTLSGFGYKGHVFWDTELFMLPPLTLTLPERARVLLMYRWHNLAGARAKAAEAGYEGAMFPWESTDTGEETTPRWTDPHPVTGERVRIWTGDNEQHISSDIAYAALQYWRWTGDTNWLLRHGAELVLDTARFWGSRAEFNAEAGRYELRMQIGPDEYHENVDNSVFTNRLVKWHLEQALDLLAHLNTHHPEDAARLRTALDLSPARLDHWRDVAERMWVNVDDERRVYEQFEGFFARLQPFNLADYTPRVRNMDWILGHERTQRARVIKQADVVMLMALLGDALVADAPNDPDFLRRNWDTYLPIVDHGSSLSPSIHAWVAARLGLLDDAYRLFIYAATIDLDDHKGNVRDGIHAASCGGVWQSVVFGFAGLHLTEDGPQVKPHLPAHWRSLRFTVMHKGQPHHFSITNDAAIMTEA